MRKRCLLKEVDGEKNLEKGSVKRGVGVGKGLGVWLVEGGDG